ncbi:Uncharacterized conserved protein, DUF2336 family [Tistlia consotensis]|uniref:Uncharacterized conserved protein, DUF2336 family n=1 Tax=Tistlia consotensis USBA 355 TaxID=560819 RepID=A0A1Y6B3K1_9PROT|nr:DUF2336 domain-containing protein [Tistlia consotensis]SME87771.1 Uncharacterized conserved protein, DUF2336 family [Tistlia consotensis USBA 355]SNR24125.1 Uncharacterized conserved protein, DUF2336 family [Tistlia consotensis]
MSQSKPTPLLSSEQVERLLRDPSPQSRGDTAEAVGRLIAAAPLTEAERALANDIIEVLAQDLEQTVREAVARSLKDCPLLPQSMARRLAEDVEAVALPILSASEVLGEDDLLALVRDGVLAKQLAIAGRPRVSPGVSHALVETGRPPVITTLLANPGAEIREDSLHRIIDLSAADETLGRALVERPYLPLAVQQRLVGTISQELCDLLVQRHGLPGSLIERFVRQGGEGALTRLVRREPRIEEVEQLVRRLHAEGRLTTTLVLRALLEGDLQLFEAAMARLAGVPTANARTVMYRGGLTGLRRLYGRTGLAPELFGAVRLGIQVARDLGVAEGDRIPEDAEQAFANRLIQRVVASYREVYPAELETVLSQLALRVATPGGTGG